MLPRRIYQVYGLRIDSDLPLPAELASGDDPVDLNVRGSGTRPQQGDLPDFAGPIEWGQTNEGWSLRYVARSGNVLEFAYSPDASRIEIRHSASGNVDSIGAMLVGAGLGAALHLRGIPAVHASALVVAGGAILLAGPSGAGKSTLTAALVSQGAPLLSEDLAVPAFCSGRILIQAGYPRLRLRPDAAPFVGLTRPDLLPRVFGPRAVDDKRWIEVSTLPGGFHATPAPLRAIYLLAPRQPDRESLTIESLPPQRAGLALLEHRYGADWLRMPQANALEWCAQIAGRTPVRMIHAPDGLSHLSETAAAIMRDCQTANP